MQDSTKFSEYSSIQYFQTNASGYSVHAFLFPNFELHFKFEELYLNLM